MLRLGLPQAPGARGGSESRVFLARNEVSFFQKKGEKKTTCTPLFEKSARTSEEKIGFSNLTSKSASEVPGRSSGANFDQNFRKTNFRGEVRDLFQKGGGAGRRLRRPIRPKKPPRPKKNTRDSRPHLKIFVSICVDQSSISACFCFGFVRCGPLALALANSLKTMAS